MARSRASSQRAPEQAAPNTPSRATRATRAARSQSHELGTPWATVNAQTRKSGSAQRELIILEEEFDEDEEEEEGEEEETHESKETGVEEESDSDNGNMIDAEEAILDLPGLYGTAVRILQLFGQEPMENMQTSLANPGSRLNRKVVNYQVVFESDLQTFGVQGLNDFISKEDVHGVLFHPYPAPPINSRLQDWRLDDAFARVNLACLSWQLSGWSRSDGVDGEDGAVWNELAHLDRMFPSHFTSSFVPSGAGQNAFPPGGSQLLEDTLKLALEIRTQTAIRHLATQQLDEDDLPLKLREIFYRSDPDGAKVETVESMEQRGLIGWDADELGPKLSPRHRKLVLGRIQEIESHLPDEDFQSSDDYLATLRNLYPWSGFILQALKWVRLRDAEVSKSIERHGDIQHIIAFIKRERENHRNGPHIAEDPSVRGEHDEITEGNEEMEDDQNGSSAEPASTLRQGQQSRPLLVGPDREQMRNLTLKHYSTIAAGDAQNKEAKENRRTTQSLPAKSFMDTQDNAALVAWEGISPSQDQPESSRKRSHAEIDDDVSQDVGFQPRAKSNASKRQRFFTMSSSILSASQDTDEAFNALVQRAGSIQQVGSSSARIVSTHTRPAIPVEKRGRRAWTVEETGALIVYIEQYGASWARIKEIDNLNHRVLKDRDQVALKDKARNMKYEALRNGTNTLHKNFDLVYLNAMMKKRLASLGIEFE